MANICNQMLANFFIPYFLFFILRFNSLSPG
jgi:hypothetical protein